MKIRIKIIIIILVQVILGNFAMAAPLSRVKDIARVLGARENQLMGFGLVVGLRNTGDSQSTGFTKQAITNLLSKMGVPPEIDFKSRNAAAVMVTANLPPFVKSGQKLDITVSSLGDSTSLSGGTLLLTPLTGPDSNVYAVAQGNISTNYEMMLPNLPPIKNTSSTTGRIPDGAIVEKEVPISLFDKGYISIVLNEPDFTTAKRMSDAIIALGYDSSIIDAGTVKVNVADSEDAFKTIAEVENATLVPDAVAKIVINERTGTIVFGENVRIAEIAVSYGNINVTIGPINLSSDSSIYSSSTNQNNLRIHTNASMRNDESPLRYVESSAKLIDLVRALNAIKANPKELISILQAIKKVGALRAELEII